MKLKSNDSTGKRTQSDLLSSRREPVGENVQEYEAAAKSIRRQIDSFYSKYAGKYGLTYDQAIRLLNRKESQEWKAALGDYVATIEATTDPSVKAVLKAQLDALSANSSISAWKPFKGQIDLILNDPCGNAASSR